MLPAGIEAVARCFASSYSVVGEAVSARSAQFSLERRSRGFAEMRSGLAKGFLGNQWSEFIIYDYSELTMSVVTLVVDSRLLVAKDSTAKRRSTNRPRQLLVPGKSSDFGSLPVGGGIEGCCPVGTVVGSSVTQALAETKRRKSMFTEIWSQIPAPDWWITMADFADEIERFFKLNMDYVLQPCTGGIDKEMKYPGSSEYWAASGWDRNCWKRNRIRQAFDYW